MFSWFDTKEERQLGVSLAGYYISRVPAQAPFSKSKFAAKTQDTLKKMGTQLDAFKRDHSLNVYKKAKLGNAFKWTLRDAGYDQEYVDELTEWLMLRI